MRVGVRVRGWRGWGHECDPCTTHMCELAKKSMTRKLFTTLPGLLFYGSLKFVFIFILFLLCAN